MDGREVNSRGLSRQQMRVWARTAQCKPCPVRAELAGWDLFEHDAFFQVTEGEPDHCMVTLEPVESSRLGAVSPDSVSDDVVDGSFRSWTPGPGFLVGRCGRTCDPHLTQSSHPPMEETSMYEYKVLTQRDPRLGGGFEPDTLESTLNSYANEGWRLVVAMATGNMLEIFRAEMVMVLERVATET